MSRRPSPRQAASRRLADLVAIATHRRRVGSRLDPSVWLFALANALGHAPASNVPMRGGQVWRGLDLLELRRVVQMIDLGDFADDELGEQISRITVGAPLIAAQKLGEVIRLTVDERLNLDIRGIDAAGQSKAERRAEAKARKLTADAERQQQKRALKRATGLVQSRAEFLAGSCERRKPWLAEGCCRRTWYARQRKLAQVASHDLGASDAQIASHASGTSAAQVQSRTLSIGGSATAPVQSVDIVDPASIRRQTPSPAFAAAAGSTVADGTTITTSRKAGSLGSRDGLVDECQPESEAQKKSTARPGQTIQEEDPRERLLLDVFRDRNSGLFVAEEIGEGSFSLGFERAALLGRDRLQRLRRRLSLVGILSDKADTAIAEAREAAIEMERSTAARRAKA